METLGRVSKFGRSLRRRLLVFLRKRLGSDPPRLRLVFWDGEAFDFVPAPAVTIQIHSRKVVRHFLTGNISRLGDAYARGDLDAEGRIEDIIREGVDLARRIGRAPFLSRIARLAALARHRHSKAQDRAAISYHYDVSNDFYRLWLDREMNYSCAYFQTGAEDIDNAQRQKIEHICRKLRLTSGERLLDVGCGWGGLLRFAALNFGIRGTGVTISKEQHRYASDRIAAGRLDDRVEISLQDYRDIPGSECFDKIVSVGMYEHVGLSNQRLYFDILFRLLKPGGILLNHGIISGNPGTSAIGPPGGEFIDRHVFPGGELPPLPALLHTIAGSGFEPVDIEDLRPHYARTLLLWSERLEANASEACRLAGPGRFRIWRVYLPAMAFAFGQGLLSVVQILAYKPLASGMAPRPWTRAHQYERIGTARELGRLASEKFTIWCNFLKLPLFPPHREACWELGRAAESGTRGRRSR